MAETKIQVFSWDLDKAHWDTNKINGTPFMAPAGLPCVMFDTGLMAVCLSGHKSGGYSVVPFVPHEAVFVSNPDREQSDDFVADFISDVKSNSGHISQTAVPVSGYAYWSILGRQNSDSSSALTAATKITNLNWGFLFRAKNMRLCRVWIQKDCDVQLGNLDVNKIVSPDEKRLVEEIASSLGFVK